MTRGGSLVASVHHFDETFAVDVTELFQRSSFLRNP